MLDTDANCTRLVASVRPAIDSDCTCVVAVKKYRAMATLFNERKTAQAGAFLLHMAGGRLPLLKLVKLMYLAERESLRLYGEPLTGDSLVSMPHGPVLSRTYDQMKGSAICSEGGWDTWIADQSDYAVALRDPSMIRDAEQDLLALSDTDIEVLSSVWRQFGHLDKWAIRDYTHDHCAEWKDPDGSSVPIAYADVFRALGFSEEQLKPIVSRIETQRQLRAAL